MEQAVLTKDQELVLALMRQKPELAAQFYLTGGTALAGFYLRHRYSDDLDFFTEEKEFPQFQVEAFTDEIRKAVQADGIIYRRLHDRRIFFFQKNGEELKVEFTYYPFRRLHPAAGNALSIDTLEDIAANKMMALMDRIEAKDFVDLYFIMTEGGIPFEKLRALVAEKFHYTVESVTWGSEFAKARWLDKLPRMLKPVTLEELKTFFAARARELAPEILK